jgi:hypothetical protein
MRQEARTRKVPVCNAVAKTETFNVTVPVPRQVVRKVNVQVCEMVQHTEKVKFQVCEYKTEAVKRKVPVTTYKTVSEVVEVTVPVTRCVPVPCPPPPVCQ